MRERTGQNSGTVVIRLVTGVIAISVLLFLPAGTISFWQGWLYLAVIFVPMAVVLVYLVRCDPELLARRLQLREKERVERSIIAVSSVFFLALIVIPALDHRFGWSIVPVAVVLASDVAVFLGYLIFFLTLRENTWASRIIEVGEGQKVISTGPYAHVRHPMYLGVILMALFTPTSLGSLWGIPAVIPVLAMIVLRIRNEEEVLLRDLPGYREYCSRTPWHLVPLVW